MEKKREKGKLGGGKRVGNHLLYSIGIGKWLRSSRTKAKKQDKQQIKWLLPL
jgi:hypothetical protein